MRVAYANCYDRTRMLELRTNCECCDRDLLPGDPAAFICSFECTFCSACTAELGGVCPNCGGELVRRPLRPAQFFARIPAAQKRVRKLEDCPPQKRRRA